MKITREHLAENRRHLLDAAARLLRAKGPENVSVAEVTKAAGLTHGAFYNHFRSKDDLITQAFAHVLRDGPARPPPDLAAFARHYLRREHRDNRGEGCMFAALAAEVPRLSPEAQAVMTQALKGLIERLSVNAPGETPAERRRAAISHWAAMVGALVLARAVDDPVLSDELLEETLRSCPA